MHKTLSRVSQDDQSRNTKHFNNKRYKFSVSLYLINSMTTAYMAIWMPVPQQCTIHIPDTDLGCRDYRHITHHIWIMLQPLECTAIMEHLVMYHKQQIIWVLFSQTNVIKKLFMGKFIT
jgi:hypothetical protein